MGISIFIFQLLNKIFRENYLCKQFRNFFVVNSINYATLSLDHCSDNS